MQDIFSMHTFRRYNHLLHSRSKALLFFMMELEFDFGYQEFKTMQQPENVNVYRSTLNSGSTTWIHRGRSISRCYDP